MIDDDELDEGAKGAPRPDVSGREKRWRLVLGAPADAELGARLDEPTRVLDHALEQLYDAPQGGGRKGGLGRSQPAVARWLGDIRTYFPSSVVRVMQEDALERLKLTQMLTEPELLESLEPDVHLVANLISLAGAIPARTKETARLVVRRVVEQLEARLRNPMQQAVRGALSRAVRTRRPRADALDWDRTIKRNLHTWDPARRVMIPERLVGHGRRQSSLRDVVLCVDQSGSMASSVVYSSIFAAVLASIRAVRTKLVVFDTSIVDLTDLLADPVDVLFGTRLGGGTDIHRALAYCETLIERPSQTVFVLITDLFEGGDPQGMIQRAAHLVASGVQVVCLLALSDDGAPFYDAAHAQAFAALGIPTFACTPDLFPELMAAALQRRDLGMWAARHDIPLRR